MGVDSTVVPTTGVDQSALRTRRLTGRWSGLALAVIVVVGGGLRLLDVRWGLPHRLHPDEAVITNGALEMAARNSFEPPSFFRPDHLEMQLSTLAYRVYSQVTAGVPAEIDYAVNPTPYLVLSRVITVAFGILAIGLAYRIGARFGGVSAVTAAFLVAFFPPFVANSSYATPDVPLTCLLLGVILASMRYIERPGWPNLALTCFGIALATTVKYPGALGAALVLVMLLIVGFRGDWRRSLRHAIGSPFLYLAGIFILSPVLITNLGAVVEQFRAQSGSTHLGADGLGWTGNLGFYSWSLAGAAGVVLLGTAVVGAVWAVRTRTAVAAPLVLGVVYWLLLSLLPLHWDRWGLPMYLTPVLLAAVGAGRVVAFVQERRRNGDHRWRAQAMGAAVLGGISTFALLAGAAAESARLLGPETRVVATPAFEALGVTQRTAVYDGYTPLLPGGARTILRNVTLVNGRVQVHGSPNVRFIVVSSMMYDRYRTDDRYAEEWATYRALDEQLPLVASWTPVFKPPPSPLEPVTLWGLGSYVSEVSRGGLVGPSLKVYAVPGQASTER